ncbi:hypothetical protein NGRA_2731 [Nosema granulosis]|uniref:Uncharacterized protein n=1 Tax=Nosema granulosis TaxID=83296 RepID=A0A9P6GW25_9MICR|nr:hypothetical protein NGRA_2731 [Nosema granulosis]
MNDTFCKTLLDEICSTTFYTYNEEAVNKIQEHCKFIDSEINNIKESVGDGDIPEDVSINYIMLTFYKTRCIRILRTYHLKRILQYQDLKFNTQREKNTIRKIQKLEEDYLNRFNLNYAGSVPLLSYVKIVTEKDCGIVYDGEEMIELKKGRIYFVRRKTIEHLLKGGYIKIMK